MLTRAGPPERSRKKRVSRWGCRYLVHEPRVRKPDAPLLVSVHGISRNAREHRRRMAPVADSLGATLLVPLFGRDRRGYQRMRAPEHETAADLDLLGIVDELGAGARGIDLVGFSGGAQFAHRFALAHPRRVRRLVALAAGWYTMPDEHARYPYGLRTGTDAPPCSLDGLLRIPTLIAVGSQDTARDRALRRGSSIDRIQGLNRVVRAVRFANALRRAAIERGHAPAVELRIVPGAGHSFADVLGDAGFVRGFLTG